MKQINLVMITKNEEKNIGRCISLIKDYVNKIIIIDTGSVDNTKKIALDLGAVVYDYKWDDNFSNARNYGLKKSDADWNLILDADEYITEFDVDNVNKFIKSNKNIIGQIKIVNLFEQDGEIKKSNVYISRLAPKGVYFEGAVHEQLDISIPRKIINIEVEHNGYLKNKFDRNISLILKELDKDSKDIYMNYQAAKTYYSNKMHNEAQIYFEKFYSSKDSNTNIFFKDGIVLYLYNIIKLKKFDIGLKVLNDVFDKLNDYCDFHFVCGIFFMELVLSDVQKYISYFDNIEISYLNALQVGEYRGFIESVEGTGSYLAAFNLGVFYELKGDKVNAFKYYKLSSNYGYSKARNRIELL